MLVQVRNLGFPLLKLAELGQLDLPQNPIKAHH
jgi:hypothetical protein